jgi:hypothetical protein
MIRAVVALEDQIVGAGERGGIAVGGAEAGDHPRACGASSCAPAARGQDPQLIGSEAEDVAPEGELVTTQAGVRPV